MMKYCPNLKSIKMESHQIKEYEFQNENPNKDEIEVIILTKMKIHLKSSTIDCGRNLMKFILVLKKDVRI